MSASPFMLPQPPRVTQEEALDTARLWKGMSDHLATIRDMAGSRRAMQESQWWMAYSVALGQVKPSDGE